MLVDTDVLIWLLRGNVKAAQAIDRASDRAVSVFTYMELLQGARDKREVRAIKSFLTDMQFRMLPLNENVGHRASIYMEEYSRTVAMTMADALIAAASVEANEPLLTANDKHYRPIKELDMKRFRP
jgi:predicted nucleic acid-binding protein